MAERWEVWESDVGPLLCVAVGVMHRDLKPENILLCNDASDCEVKVIDYGVAAFFKKGMVVCTCILINFLALM